MRNLFFLTTFFLLFFLSIEPCFAQCAMCRATVETNANNGDITTALGLNKGILYLFCTPYILVGILIVFFRYQKKYKKLT